MSLDLGRVQRKTASWGRSARNSYSRINTRSRIDSEGAQGQTSQINVTAATNDGVYSVRVQGRHIDETVTVTLDGDATQTEARDALIAAINANSLILAYAASVTAGSNLLIITWNVGAPTMAVSFPLNPGTDLTLTAGAAVAAPQYAYGEAAEVVAMAASGKLMPSGIRRPVEIAGAIIGIDETHNASDEYAVTFLLDGISTPVAWSAGGSAAATDTAAKAALDAALPTGTTTVIDGTGELTVSFTPGVKASVVSATVDGTGPITAVVDSAAAALPKFCLIADDLSTTPNDTGAGYTGEPIGPRIGTAVLTADASGGGVEWATEAPGVALSEGDPVYVETDGADRGRLFSVPSLTRTLWPEAKWVGVDSRDPLTATVAL